LFNEDDNNIKYFFYGVYVWVFYIPSVNDIGIQKDFFYIEEALDAARGVHRGTERNDEQTTGINKFNPSRREKDNIRKRVITEISIITMRTTQ
jgi:hypothetical protein